MNCNHLCDYEETNLAKEPFGIFPVKKIKDIVIGDQVAPNIFKCVFDEVLDGFVKYLPSDTNTKEVWIKERANTIYGIWKCKHSGEYLMLTEDMPKLSYNLPLKPDIIQVVPEEIIQISGVDQITGETRLLYQGFPINYELGKELDLVTKFKINKQTYDTKTPLSEEQYNMLVSQRRLEMFDKKYIKFYSNVGDAYINQLLRFGLDEISARKIYDSKEQNKKLTVEQYGEETYDIIIPSEKKINKLIRRAQKAVYTIDTVFEKKVYRSDKTIYLLRGMKLDSMVFEFDKKILYKNYVSTTGLLDVARKFTRSKVTFKDFVPEYNFTGYLCCLLLLEIEPGIPILGTEFSSEFSYEDEYILPRDLYFQLTGVSDYLWIHNKRFKNYVNMLHVRVTQH